MRSCPLNNVLYAFKHTSSVESAQLHLPVWICLGKNKAKWHVIKLDFFKHFFLYLYHHVISTGTLESSKLKILKEFASLPAGRFTSTSLLGNIWLSSVAVLESSVGSECNETCYKSPVNVNESEEGSVFIWLLRLWLLALLFAAGKSLETGLGSQLYKGFSSGSCLQQLQDLGVSVDSSRGVQAAVPTGGLSTLGVGSWAVGVGSVGARRGRAAVPLPGRPDPPPVEPGPSAEGDLLRCPRGRWSLGVCSPPLLFSQCSLLGSDLVCLVFSCSWPHGRCEERCQITRAVSKVGVSVL